MRPDVDIEGIIERGTRAGRLLSDPDFLGVVDDLSAEYLAQLVAAPPGDGGREARDYAHLMHHALSQIVSELATRKAAADELAQRQPNEDD